MKRCKACGEEFTGKFLFCPVDGTTLALARVKDSALSEFHLTLINDEGLGRRLANQFRFVTEQASRAWPSFKSDPIGFALRRIVDARTFVRQIVARPHVLSGGATAMLVVSAIVLGVMLLESHAPKMRAEDSNDSSDEALRTVEIDLRRETKANQDAGVGVGEKGRVGFGKGKGEGSGAQAGRAQGGGGGGNGNPLPPSLGRLPAPSIIPAPISTTMARLPQALPEAGINIDPALWKNLSLTSYGDPRSKSNTPSNGPGRDGGVGNGKGTSIGEGEGPGFGPGRKGNIGGGENTAGCCGEGGSVGNNPNPDLTRTYSAPEVSERARACCPSQSRSTPKKHGAAALPAR